MGLDTFGDVTLTADGDLASHAQVIRNVVAEGVLADTVGVDFFGVGEHHRSDFPISSPETVLAAIAAQTRQIRLGSAVTVLSTDDPVRIFQRFAILNAISQGRAEVILGRGAFTESFTLFGYPLPKSDALFAEKLDLFAKLLKSDRARQPFDWRGTLRPSVTGLQAFPATEDGRLPTWIGVSGTPDSVRRAAKYGMRLMLAIVSGPASRFRAYVDLYHQVLSKQGFNRLAVGVHSPGHIAKTDAQARAATWPRYQAVHDRIAAARGLPLTTYADFEREIVSGSLYIGSPDTVARKIASTVRTLSLSRFQMKYSGAPHHDDLMVSVELYGQQVAPKVQEILAQLPVAQATHNMP